MALTLNEAAKLSNDMLLQGVAETIIKDSPILQQLPFIEIVGNGLTYNREKTLPTIDFYDVGDIWAESTPTFEQITTTLGLSLRLRHSGKNLRRHLSMGIQQLMLSSLMASGSSLIQQLPVTR